MKLYLADEEKLNSFSLPEKPEESFLFSYTSPSTNIEIFFNVFEKDNNWYIKQNEDFIINESDVFLMGELESSNGREKYKGNSF